MRSLPPTEIGIQKCCKISLQTFVSLMMPMPGHSLQTRLFISMMATVSTTKDNKPKKRLDIHVGDMVYFRSDPALEAGVGIVLSTEYRSFDIYDFRDLGISCFINQVGPASVPRICVLWVGKNKSMWMDRQDIIVLNERIT